MAVISTKATTRIGLSLKTGVDSSGNDIKKTMNLSKIKVSLTIPNIKAAVTQVEVSAAMDAIIAHSIFYSSGGDFKTKYTAQLTQRQVTKWALV